MPNYMVNDVSLTSVANAIRVKGGTSAPLVFPEGFVTAIENLPTESTGPGGDVTQDSQGYLILNDEGSGGGGGLNIDDPIRFFDYDGTLVASYTGVPDALPAVPTHTGLKNGAWNYTLAQIETQFNAMGTCTVGANYMTESEKTEIDVEFVDAARLSPYLQLVVNGTVTIDWGDGSATEDATGSNLTTRVAHQHTYSQVGNYTITVELKSGTAYGIYGHSGYLGLLSSGSGTAVNNYIYANCVKAIRLGASCTTLMNYAFLRCMSLKTITLPPTGITTFNNYVFSYCESLQFVAFPALITRIPSYALEYSYGLSNVSIPSTVTSIDQYAFRGCNSLTSMSISYGVTTLGSYVFYACGSIRSITFPQGVSSTGTYACQNCYSLTSVEFLSEYTNISNYAFQNCYSLKEISIPSKSTTLGTYAFSGCYSLQSIEIPSTITSIPNYTFYQCYALENLVIPSTVTSIGTYAFNGCYCLRSINIPSGITAIPQRAFYNCYALTSITIPSGVTSFDTYAFYMCYSLSSITIPSGVSNIPASTFSSCTGMKEYHILKSDAIVTLANTNAFAGIPSDCVIYVPKTENHALLDEYKAAANWSTYADYIQEEP